MISSQLDQFPVHVSVNTFIKITDSTKIKLKYYSPKQIDTKITVQCPGIRITRKPVDKILYNICKVSLKREDGGGDSGSIINKFYIDIKKTLCSKIWSDKNMVR